VENAVQQLLLLSRAPIVHEAGVPAGPTSAGMCHLQQWLLERHMELGLSSCYCMAGPCAPNMVKLDCSGVCCVHRLNGARCLMVGLDWAQVAPLAYIIKVLQS
jgi:hypothetical protein